METLLHDPTEGIYATTDDYAHAIELREPRRLLFVAGTMGLDAAGAPPATLREQLELVWANIGRILRSAGMTFDDIVRVTSYLRERADAEINGRARMAALGGRAIPTTAIVAGRLSDDWLVEIEVIAAA